MARYECSVCGYVWDEQTEGKKWNQLPHDWVCPVCGAAKSQFSRADADTPERAVAPPIPLVGLHRALGYVFLALYLLLLVQMIPRLWTYQIEFPARTVVHITIGMAIGAIILLKITIIRFSRQANAALIPLLGTALFVNTVILIGISVPFTFHEAVVSRAATVGGLFGPENLQRVSGLLLQAGLQQEEQRDLLASPQALRAGRQVLRRDCTECHDLRTVLARPRTPQNWRQTVSRMADRTTALQPIDDDEQWQVTAYLIAISPQLQQSTRKKRDQQELGDQTKKAAKAVAAGDVKPTAYDDAAAEQLFETKCSQCHATSLVAEAPPASADAARELLALMVEEGLSATQDELAQIARYLTQTYAVNQ